MKKNKYSTPLWMLATILAGMLLDLPLYFQTPVIT